MDTPYYLIDEAKLLRNLEIIARLREASGAKFVLALKCFSTWCVFERMRHYLDGTTSSSLNEARLGHEKFGGETHAYSVAWPRAEAEAVAGFADKIIFNSIGQLEALGDLAAAASCKIGLRANPRISYSHYDLADPARPFSRLGVAGTAAIERAAARLSGLMFHFNCENDDFANFSGALDQIGTQYGAILKQMEWVSLGGGIAFTHAGYPVEALAARLKAFGGEFGVQVYLEPGEAAITGAAQLVVSVLDVVHNEIDVAIVDASVEAHMLDHLIYHTSPRIDAPGPGAHAVMIAGRSCLAGDVFGRYSLEHKLAPGAIVHFADAAGYTMVKKNWFNGLPMPAIRLRRQDGREETIRAFSYEDYVQGLS